MLCRRSSIQEAITMKTTPTSTPAGFIRRMGAWLYDSVLVLALEVLIAGLIVLLVDTLLGWMPSEQYPTANDLLGHHPVISPLFTLFLATIWVSFFVYFWTKKGQTLGMKAWGLRLSDEQGQPVTITQSLIRLATSAFGLSNLLAPFDYQKRGFQDMWAKTQLTHSRK